MLYYPEGNNSYKYIPTSPHYRMLHFLGTDDDYTKSLKALIESLLEKDAQGEDYIVQEPPAKKRKRQQAAHIVRINSTVLWQDVGEDLNEKFSYTQNVTRLLYDNFEEELIMQGRIAWRYHSDEADVCIMNDVVPTTGVLSPNAFVHVMKTTDYAGQDIIKCTCSIFDFIRHLQTHILMLKHHVLIVDSTMNFCKMHLRQQAITLWKTSVSLFAW